MKQFLLNIILGVALILPFRSHTQDTEAIIRERVDANETPGIVVAVYENGKTQFYSFGYADVASKRPPGPKTLFEIGSITKTFTTTSLALLAEEGKLSLSDPVQKFLPDSVKAPERDGKSITLVDLATARSGLPRMPSNMKPADEENPYIDYDVQKMFDFLSGYTLTREIGSQYEYSNFGMGLLGVVIARIEHKSYSEVIATKILKPLQMKNTFLNTPKRKDKDPVEFRVPTGSPDVIFKRFNDLLGDTDHTQHKVPVPVEDVKKSGLIKERVLIHHPANPTNAEMGILEEAARRWQAMTNQWQTYCRDEGDGPDAAQGYEAQNSGGTAAAGDRPVAARRDAVDGP